MIEESGSRPTFEDAIRNRTFKGPVIEIENTAIVHSTGLAASQSTTSNAAFESLDAYR
jgi:hypothetical protein